MEGQEEVTDQEALDDTLEQILTKLAQRRTEVAGMVLVLTRMNDIGSDATDEEKAALSAKLKETQASVVLWKKAEADVRLMYDRRDQDSDDDGNEGGKLVNGWDDEVGPGRGGMPSGGFFNGTSGGSGSNSKVPANLPKFRGSGTDDPQEFLDNFVKVCTAHDLDEERYLKVVPLCLESVDAKWVERWTIENGGRDSADWEKFMEDFRAHFQHPNSAVVWQNKIRNLLGCWMRCHQLRLTLCCHVMMVRGWMWTLLRRWLL